MVVAAYLGPSLMNLVLLIALTSWARPARVIHAATLSAKQMPYLEAAVALGARTSHILRVHVLPAVLPVVFAQLVSLLESSLSFMGLGDPTQKSWGSMLFYAQVRGAFLNGSWPWWALPPGFLITASVLAFSLAGRRFESLARS